MWLNKQPVIIVILVLLNIALIIRHLDVLKRCSQLNGKECEIILDEERFSGVKIPDKIIEVVNKIDNNKSGYFFVLLFRGNDCGVCLNYASLLLNGKNIKMPVLGIYASNDLKQKDKLVWMYKFEFPIIQDTSIINSLSIKRTPFIFFIKRNGAIIYAYYPNYLKPEGWKKFLLKVEALK